jgi:hypothetical protein
MSGCFCGEVCSWLAIFLSDCFSGMVLPMSLFGCICGEVWGRPAMSLFGCFCGEVCSWLSMCLSGCFCDEVWYRTAGHVPVWLLLRRGL